MGLMTPTQDDAERVLRQEKNVNRGYLHDVRGIKAEGAPHEAVVKDYNAQVEGFKNSSVRNPGNDELWQVIGWVRDFQEFGEKKVFSPVGAPGSKWQLPSAELYKGAYSGGLGYGFEGGWMWGSSPKATVRSTEGVALSSMDANSMNPSSVYASWNDRPFVAPLTAAQTTTAKASDEALAGLGEQATARTAEYDKAAAGIETKADRIAMDVEMGQNRAGEVAPASASVFDQNLSVFQSIADWLK